MRYTADDSLTPEQEQVRGVVDRYARIAGLVTSGVLSLGLLYLAAIYLVAGR